MASYDIRPLQLHILKILQAIDKVCQEHHLRYYLWAGTMLGAVRHKGFIPWDDDLDIAMPRPDYDLLMQNAHEWLPNQFEVISFETDKNYPLPFAKIQDANTTLIERRHMKYLGGVYLDVFPLDGMTSNPLIQRIHFAHYFYWKKVQYFLFRDPYRHGHGPSSWIPLLCRKFYTLDKVQQKMKNLQTKYDYDSSEYVVDHDDGRHGVLKRSILGTPTPTVFEECRFVGLQHADEYLSNKYGDYMTIPPGPKQRQHNFYLMDLNKPYKSCKHLLEHE